MRHERFLAVVLLAVPLPICAAIPQSQRDALIALYQSTNGSGWTNKTNWNGAPGTECTWFGVTCDAPQVNVTSVVLQSNNLTGSIPSQIGNLTALQTLRLMSNKIGGPLPREIGPISSLQVLNVIDNQLSGPIPPELGQLSNLVVLRLARNRLSGSIPPELGQLSKLVFLQLAGNRLSGSIPPELGRLSNLQYLYIFNSQLNGPIPPQIGQLRNLLELGLGGNQLSGTIPREMSQLTKLQFLSLSFNQLTGSIPPEFGDLTSLQELYLIQNQFTGTIPTQIGQLTNLKNLYLNYNRLTGEIPSSFAQLQNLQQFSVSANQLTGTIPSWITQSRTLQVLGGGANQFSGPLPDFTSTQWQLMRLDGNQFRGPVPSSYRNLVNLGTRVDPEDPESIGYIDIRYNATHTTDPVLESFLNSKQLGGDWKSTQTVAPTNVSARALSDTTILVSWTSIPYKGDPGGYQVLVSTTSGGPYTLALTTSDKNASSAVISGLTPSTKYFFTVKTLTAPHNYPSPNVGLTDTQTSALLSDAAAETSATTLAPAPLPPNVVVGAFPPAITQQPGVGGATVTYTLANSGGTATTIALSRSSTVDFFMQSPASLTLAPGETKSVQITTTAQPAGTYEGTSIPSGAGVPAGTAIPIKLLVASPPPVGQAIATPVDNRVDVSAPQEINPTVSISFTNRGNATLTGVLTSDALWLIPPSGVVTISPGETVTITLLIDRTKRPDNDILQGSARATVSLVYFGGTGSGKSSWPNDGTLPPPSVSLVTVVDTVKPAVSAGSIPPLAAGEVALFVPGIGHVQGSVGKFISDFGIVNATGVNALTGIKLYQLPIGSSSASTMTISTLSQSQSMVLADIAKSVFNNESTVASVQIRTPDYDKISVVANIFNISNPLGTYGTTIPLFRSDRAIAAGQRLYLTGVLRQEGLSHTNLYLQETSGASATATIEYFDMSGQSLGTSATTVAPFALQSIGNAVPRNGVLAIITNDSTSAGKILAYATPVDEKSGDTWSVADWARQNNYAYDEEVVIPVAGAAAGANNTYFRTDVAITNVGSSAASGVLRYFPIGGNVQEQRLTLDTMQSNIANDVVTTMLKLQSGSIGYLTFIPDVGGKFAITSRTYTTVQGQSATFGTGVPTLARSSGLRLGQSKRIGVLDDASLPTIIKATPGTFRTNFGLIETAGKDVTVRATLLYDEPHPTYTAKKYGSTTFALRSNESTLIRNVAKAILGSSRDTDLGDLRNVQLQIDVIAGDGAVLVYTSSVDNGTGDSTLRSD